MTSETKDRCLHPAVEDCLAELISERRAKAGVKDSAGKFGREMYNIRDSHIRSAADYDCGAEPSSFLRRESFPSISIQRFELSFFGFSPYAAFNELTPISVDF